MQQAGKQALTIGRTGTNDIVIANPEVSRTHARITFITDHVLLLEDMDSAFGTMVNGQRIARKIIDLNDAVVLANKEPLDLRLVLARRLAHTTPPPPPQATPPPPPPTKLDPLDFKAEFKKLERMQQVYSEAREAIQINSPRHQSWLRATFALAPLLGIVTFGAGTVAALTLGVFGAAIGQIVASQAINPTEKLLALDKEFKQNYTCPNPACNRFLGNTPYTDLVFQKQCPRCKAKWAG
ncbi:FHA domain-containing protein [Spirosoma sp.]|uniref:FHA domain-containing protein n=1 Tax=Spirosoma sp. TaxID=1899569 RepID=UPI00262C0B27|nr:FHA domain-containing protein [Spirosoma sp.]MCX6216968.1 FHA domain-containing protein [Spirosoma sp.]